MKILLAILSVLSGIVLLLLLIALFMRKEHYVKRQIVINASSGKVFEFLRHLKNQDKFNKWATADKANRIEHFKGIDGEVGFIYSWSGNKEAGKGEKEIIDLKKDKRVETEIRFEKPMRVSARVNFEIDSISENQSKVSIINTGKLPYPINIMIPLAERNFPKDMDASLHTLKSLLESE